MSITTSGSGESQREAHKARRTLVWHSILFTARRLGFAYIHSGAPGAGFSSMWKALSVSVEVVSLSAASSRKPAIKG